MHRVLKYPLDPAFQQTVAMPGGARVVRVAYQREKLCVWAVVQADAPVEPRVFTILGTGESIPHPVLDGQYVGTVDDPSGFVWHIWASRPAAERGVAVAEILDRQATRAQRDADGLQLGLVRVVGILTNVDHDADEARAIALAEARRVLAGEVG